MTRGGGGTRLVAGIKLLTPLRKTADTYPPPSGSKTDLANSILDSPVEVGAKAVGQGGLMDSLPVFQQSPQSQ
jgi:hypothetical protein